MSEQWYVNLANSYSAAPAKIASCLLMLHKFILYVLTTLRILSKTSEVYIFTRSIKFERRKCHMNFKPCKLLSQQTMFFFHHTLKTVM